MMLLQGKRALITGGTSGIGRAIAAAFVHAGARVVIAGRDQARGEAVACELGNATFIKADVSSLADVRRLAAAATATLGQVDILVNNAGIYHFAPTHELSEADFDAMVATNLKGPYFLTAALAPGMAAVAWAAEYGPSGVNVNAISPGPVRTEGTAGMGEGLYLLASKAPAGQPAHPSEIAAAALYLAGDDAAFVHGATLRVDGGRTAA
jgi:NAD(P)-dependent dehydrogenase (short-subunit alcohol dehydrogenase family)